MCVWVGVYAFITTPNCSSIVAVSVSRIPASMRDFSYRADGHYFIVGFS